LPNEAVRDASTGARPEMEGPKPGFDQLRDVVGSMVDAMRRKRRVFYVVAGGLFALGSAAIISQTPLYLSTAQLMVKVGRELVYQPEVGSDKAVVQRDTQSVINSELVILRSQPVIEGVVERVGLASLYPDLLEAWEAGATRDGSRSDAQSLIMAEAALRLRGALDTTALPETDVLQISFQHPDPLVARETVDGVVDEFLDAHLNAFSRPEIVQFLTERVEKYEGRLINSEGALREFQAEHASFAHEQPQIVLLQEREYIRTQSDELDSKVSAIRLSHLQDDAAVSDARSQLLQLRVEESQLKGERKVAARERRAVVQGFIDDRMSEIDLQLEPLIAKVDALNLRIVEIDVELAAMPTLAAVHRKLERERNSDEEQYSTAISRLRDARLSSDMDSQGIASVNVIQPASVTPRPVWPPSKPASVGVMAVLATIVGVLFVSFLVRVGPVGIEFFDADDVPRRKQA